MSAAMTDERDGAEAFRDLVLAVEVISLATCDELGDGFDGRDYPRMVAAIERAFADVAAASPAGRRGFARALADVLAQVADGGECGEAWDPLAASAGSFAVAKSCPGARTY